MGLPAHWRQAQRCTLAAVVVALAQLSTVGPVSAQPDDDGGPAASFLADLLGPRESFAPVDLELEGSLPRGDRFQGIELSVDRVRVTNTHPYTMFGDPRPGELFYVVVELTASNPTDVAYEYDLGDETFAFRTWSGELLPLVDAPGRYAFSRLEPGEVATDELVFGSLVPDVLDGSALLVGRPPDVPLIIPLTAPPLAADYPTPVLVGTPGPYQAGAVAWDILTAEAGLDRPPGVCCHDTGSRANEGEVFVTLGLSGRVNGSKYGQATVSTDGVRLMVDGVPQPPIDFAGQANVPEGESYDFQATWVAHEDDTGLALRFLDSSGVTATVPLSIEGVVTAALPLSSPEPMATMAASTSEPAASTSPTASAPVPSPRPATAAIATLLIYSGRPDPDWSLTAEDLAQLEDIAAGLAPVEGAPPDGGLGYKGFRVTGPQGTWRANEGIVSAPTSAPGTSLADPDRLVERFLLERGLATLVPEELDVAQQAIGAAAAPGTAEASPSAG
jgi:hypothetical protein